VRSNIIPLPRDGSDIYSPENVAPTIRQFISQSVTNSVISKSVLKQKEEKFLFITFLWLCGVCMNTFRCYRNGFISVQPSSVECNARRNCNAKIWQFKSLNVASIDPLIHSWAYSPCGIFVRQNFSECARHNVQYQ
jgi:hypothetical protein